MLNTSDCPACRHRLPETFAENTAPEPCPACGVRIRVLAFPAVFKRQESPLPRRLNRDAGESRCFYHEDNAAEAPCSHCGRYLCAVCAIKHQQQAYCTACLAAFYETSQLPKLREPGNLFHRYRSPDLRSIVALAVIIGIFFAFPIAMTILLAIYSASGGF